MRENLRKRFPDAEIARKPDGGFCFVKAKMLLAAWVAFRASNIELRDLRVWFGCFELVSRRCRLRKGRTARFTAYELTEITGMARERDVRSSIRRLERVGLINWSESNLKFDERLAIQLSPDASILEDLLNTVCNSARRVPVPRRTLGFLARTKRRSVVAVSMALMLRCLYYRERSCVSWGTCKASWIADVFKINLRTVKSARRELIDFGWVVPQTASQFRLNRHGMILTLNLNWDRPRAKSPPRRGLHAHGSPPPIRNTKLLTNSNNHEPAKRRPNGFESNNAGRPVLRRVVMEDLVNTERLQELHDRAVSRRVVTATPCDRLRFFAAAEHARRVGKTNPCGLFASIVRGKRWELISNLDEDIALLRIKRFDDGRRGDGARHELLLRTMERARVCQESA